MCNSIKNMVSRVWSWWDWENSFLVLVSLVLLFVLGISATLVYGTLFKPHSMTGCYLDRSGVGTPLSVNQNIEWQEDTVIKFCSVEDELKCVSEVMNSDLCKPQ